ncbi:MAG: lipopolysaccharide biosynthesis protein, partial [Acidimicrobiales bacterium]
MSGTVSDTEPTSGKKQVVDGARWVAVSEVARQILRVVVALFVARWLGPDEYGLAAIAILINLFLETARDLGTGEAIIQAKDIGDKEFSTLFWLNAAVGAGFFALAYLAAPFLAELFNQPTADDLIRVTSSAILFAGFGIVPRAILRRRLQFRAVAGINLFSASVNGLVAILLASQGAGAWSIAYATVVSAVMTTAAYLVICRWRPFFSYEWHHVGQVAKFSLNLSAFRLVQFFTAHGDKVIVAAAYSPADLGNYNLANRVIRNPMAVTQVSFSTVVFPALSRFQEDNPRVGAAYLRGVGVVVAVIFPIVALVVALAHPLVSFVLGDEWLVAVPIVGILALVGAVQSMTLTAGTLFRAKGRTDLLFRFGLVASPVSLLAYWLGAKVSVVGVAWGYLASVVLLFYPLFRLCLGLVDMRVRRLLKRVVPVAAAAIFTGAAVYGVRRVLENAGASELLVLSLASVSGGLV